jgi:hypothetical protein
MYNIREVKMREVNTMNTEKLLEIYESHSQADIYRIAFKWSHKIYFLDLKQIPVDWVVYRKETEHHKAKLQLRVKGKKYLVHNGLASYLMTESEWERIIGYNNGVKFEGYIWRKYKHTYKKDSKPFYEDSDIKIKGVGYQLKWENGHLVNIETLDKLVKG